MPLLLAILVLQARPADRFALTIDNIMRGPALVGYEPAQVRWSFDSQRVFFQWKQFSDKLDAPMDTYTANRDGSALRKLSEEEVKALPLPGDTSKDKRLTVYSRDGDIQIYDNTNGKVQQLTKTSDVETNPHFLPDGKHIYFTRANNLYVLSLETGFLEQMTDIRTAPAAGAAGTPAAAGGGGGGGRGQGGGRGGFGGGGRGGGAAAGGAAGGEAQPASASQEYLKKQQKELFETVRERTARKEEDDAKKKREPQRKPFTLQARQTAGALQLSPDGKYVVASVFDASTAKSSLSPHGSLTAVTWRTSPPLVRRRRAGAVASRAA